MLAFIMTIDRIRLTSTSQGTSNLTLTPESGYRNLDSDFPAGGIKIIRYVIEGRDANGEFDNQWEVGNGLRHADGSLTRTSATYSSAGDGVKQNFTSASLVISAGVTEASIQDIISIHRKTIQQKSISYQIQETDNNSVFINGNAIVTYTLPPASAGLKYEFIIAESYRMYVYAQAGNTIRLMEFVTVDGGDFNSDWIGSTLTLTAIDSSRWVVTAYTGNWLITQAGGGGGS